MQKINYLRGIPLETILINDGAKQDTHDKRKWHTTQGPISITGPKFYNWHGNCGGGGAIDLVMHLKNCSFATAIGYLKTSTPYQKNNDQSPQRRSANECKKLFLPAKNTTAIKRVTTYLINERKLPACSVYNAFASGYIYADVYANAVFLMKGRYNAIVGAELRATAKKHWKGLAPGSNKHKGAFYVGRASHNVLTICESAIDALSYVAIFPQTLAISTAGANSNPSWISNFIKKGFRVRCAFDNDVTGNKMADMLIKQYPMIKRHKPQYPSHDWNDALRAIRS